jgi:hypothetical protein
MKILVIVCILLGTVMVTFDLGADWMREIFRSR